MASVEKRIADLAEKHLGMSDRAMLDANINEFGVNSLTAVKFLQNVNKEFGVDIPPEVAVGFSTLRELIKHLGG